MPIAAPVGAGKMRRLSISKGGLPMKSALLRGVLIAAAAAFATVAAIPSAFADNERFVFVMDRMLGVAAIFGRRKAATGGSFLAARGALVELLRARLRQVAAAILVDEVRRRVGLEIGVEARLAGRRQGGLPQLNVDGPTPPAE